MSDENNDNVWMQRNYVVTQGINIDRLKKNEDLINWKNLLVK